MSSDAKVPSTSVVATVTTFFALYFTTLFSLDTWAAARGSPHRSPTSDNTYQRPANNRPAQDSYQGGMHGRGNAGPRSGDEGRRRDVGRLHGADSRPPMKMFGTAGCGACMT